MTLGKGGGAKPGREVAPNPGGYPGGYPKGGAGKLGGLAPTAAAASKLEGVAAGEGCGGKMGVAGGGGKWVRPILIRSCSVIISWLSLNNDSLLCK